MTINIKRLDKDDRRNLNQFLEFFVSRVIREHTSDGIKIGKGEKFKNWALPKNLEVSKIDLMMTTFEYYEGNGDDSKLVETDNDLALKFQKEYDNYKRFNKAKSVKFR